MAETAEHAFQNFLTVAGLNDQVTTSPLLDGSGTEYQLAEGKGYSGFAALFYFNTDGTFRFHSVEEG